MDSRTDRHDQLVDPSAVRINKSSDTTAGDGPHQPTAKISWVLLLEVYLAVLCTLVAIVSLFLHDIVLCSASDSEKQLVLKIDHE
jgi:hypothetical protein